MIDAYLTVFFFSAALLSAAAFIPFLILSKLVVEKLEKLFNAFLLGLSSMLFLNLGYISDALGEPTLQMLIEFLALVCFMAASAIVVKNSASFYIILERKKSLDAKVRAKTLLLEQKIRDLKDSRTAMIHILRDLDSYKNELEVRAKDLENLNRALADFSSELDLDALLEKIGPSARRVIGAKYAALAVLDEKGKGIERLIPDGLSNEHLQGMKGLSHPKGRGLLRAVIKRKTPLRLEDVARDKRSVGLPKDHPPMKSFLGVPIISKGKAMAALYLSEKPRGFTKEDEVLIGALASGAAASLENAKLLSDLEQAYSELLDIDRLKTDIISNVSHELRTPITIAKSALDLLAEEESAPEREKFLSMANNALIRLNDIIEDLIIASDVHTGIHRLHLEGVDLKKEIPKIVDKFESLAEKRDLSITTSIPRNLPWVRGDRKGLKKVFENLLGNAIKFSNGNGGKVNILAKKENSEVKVRIADTGVGIPQKKLDAIFAPLYQLDPTTTRGFGGTGMGLAVAKSIVDAHGGKIWAESAPGKGTSLTFTIPTFSKKQAATA